MTSSSYSSRTIPEVEYTIFDLKSKRRIVLNSKYQIISDTDNDNSSNQIEE